MVPTAPLDGAVMILGGPTTNSIALGLLLMLVPLTVTFTLSVPVMAPAGTLTVSVSAFGTDSAAAGTFWEGPLNKTTVLFGTKFLPKIFTNVPGTLVLGGMLLVGIKLVILGVLVAAVTAKLSVLVTLRPPGKITLTTAFGGMPSGTSAVMEPEGLTVNSGALTLPNSTPVAPARFGPEISTSVPSGPLVGVKPVINALR